MKNKNFYKVGFFLLAFLIFSAEKTVAASNCNGIVGKWTKLEDSPVLSSDYKIMISKDGKYQTIIGLQEWNNSQITVDLFVSSDYGVSWIKKRTLVSVSSSGLSMDLTMSPSGKYQMVKSNSDLVLSNDFGNTWRSLGGAFSFYWDMAISNDGKYQLGVGSSVYVSSDFGNNFSKKVDLSGVGSDTKIHLSSDGKYQFLTGTRPSNSNNYEDIYSSDYGASWQVMSGPQERISDFKISADGKYLFLSTFHMKNDGSSGGYKDFSVFSSSDYGVSWKKLKTKLADENYYYSVEMSEDGKYRLLADIGGCYNRVCSDNEFFSSDDYGENWKEITILKGVKIEGIRDGFQPVRMSADGKVQMVTFKNPFITYSSLDYGKNWSKDKISINVIPQDILISEDGRFRLLTTYSFSLYTYCNAEFIPGDLDEDGDVDANDFSIFQINYKKTNSDNPANLDGIPPVSTNDFSIFQKNYTGSKK